MSLKCEDEVRVKKIIIGSATEEKAQHNKINPPPNFGTESVRYSNACINSNLNIEKLFLNACKKQVLSTRSLGLNCPL